jgi:peptide/nickel transport system substrate-binding protein
VIQSMASETGFDMKIRVTEFATSLKQAEAGEYQAYMLAWSGRIDPDGNSYIFLRSNAPQNYSAWSNAEADKALDDARLVTDMAQRKAIYEKLAKIELDEEAILYIYHRRILIAHTAKLEGYKQMPDGLVRVIGLKLK